MQLQQQGLVMNHPRRGMFVNALSEEDTQKVNSVRIVLEAEALKLCRLRFSKDMGAQLNRIVEVMEKWETGPEFQAASLDLEFHRAIWNYSGNPYLVKTLDSLVPPVLAHHALEGIAHDVVRWRLNHHRALLDVIEGKSRATAEETIVTHFRMAYSNPERFSSFGMAPRNRKSGNRE